MSWLDATFGVLYDNGEELEILGGLNFIGFTITPDAANGRHDIAVSGAATASDDVVNESAVTGASVSDALETLKSAVDTNTSGIATLVAGGVNANSLALAKLVNASAQFKIVGRKTASGGAWEECSLSELAIAGSGITVTGTGNLTGGGDLTANRTIALGTALTGLTSAVFSTFVTVAGTGATTGDLRLALNGSAYSRNGQGTPNTANLPIFRNVNDVLVLGGGTEGWLGVNIETLSGNILIKVATVTIGTWSSTGLAMNSLAISGATSIGCTSLACAGPITTVTTLNGASVAAPVQGTAITTTTTIQLSGGSEYDVSSAGGAYAITLGTTGAADGDTFILRASNALANAVTVTNGGTGGGNLGPSGVMTAALKATYTYYYDGTATAWKYGGRTRCA